MNFTIRNTQPEDLDSVYQLICRLENCILDYDQFRLIYENFLNSKNRYCIIAESDSTVCALLNMRIEQQLHHSGKIAEIMELTVSPDHQTQGLGKALITSAKSYASRCGCLQLEVCCSLPRTQSHHFYEKMGLHKTHYKLVTEL